MRGEYERALNLAKTRTGAMPTPTGQPRIPVIADGGCTAGNDWRDAPSIKARLPGGHCLRAPAQGACPYANICEHCPSFRTDAASVAVLAAQRVDTEALLADAQTRGWIDEPTGTAASSTASTPSSPKPKPDEHQPRSRRNRVRPVRRHRTGDRLHGRR
jgi:hypothetical protein